MNLEEPSTPSVGGLFHSSERGIAVRQDIGFLRTELPTILAARADPLRVPRSPSPPAKKPVSTLRLMSSTFTAPLPCGP
jgi:hypothetical protein